MIYLSIIAIWAWFCIAESNQPIFLFLCGPVLIPFLLFFVFCAIVFDAILRFGSTMQALEQKLYD